MSTPTRCALLMVLLLWMPLFAGCPSDKLRVRGVVAEMDREDSDKEFQPGQRLSGVRISLDCPGEEPQLLEVTGRSGYFEHRTAEQIHGDCQLIAARNDYHSRSYSVADICARSGDDRRFCEYVGVTVRLISSVPPPPEDDEDEEEDQGDDNDDNDNGNDDDNSGDGGEEEP